MQLASHFLLVLRLRLHGGRFPLCFLVFILDIVVNEAHFKYTSASIKMWCLKWALLVVFGKV